MSLVTGTSLLGRVAGGISSIGTSIGSLVKDKMAPALADKVRGALEAKDANELARLLQQVKGMSQKGETKFLETFLKAHGREEVGQEAAEAFRDIVRSALSPKQGQALADAIFGKVGNALSSFCRRMPSSPEAREAALDRLLLSIGQPSFAPRPAVPIDGMDKLPGWVNRKLPNEISVPGPVPSEMAEVPADRDQIQAERAKNQG